MVIQLRRRHYYTWLLLAILLPLGIVLSFFNIPPTPQDPFGRRNEAAYPTVVLSQQTEAMKVNLRRNAAQKQQIEVIVLQPLVGVANQLYVSDNAQNWQQTLLGSLESTGVYRFQLTAIYPKTAVLFVTVYDALKKKEVEKIILR